MKLVNAIWERDVEAIRAYLLRRQLIDVDAELVRRWIERLRPWLEADRRYGVKHEPISHGTVDLFLRTRMGEAGYFRGLREGEVGADPEHPDNPRLEGRWPNDIWFGCEMHVFFLSVEETPEQLRRLRREDDTDDGPQLQQPMAGKTQVKIQGIDATARRVAPTQEPGGHYG